MSGFTSCKEATRLASQAIDRPLPLRSRIALAVHLSMCNACRAYRRQIRLIDRLIRERSAAAPPGDGSLRLGPEARARISAAMRERGSGL